MASKIKDCEKVKSICYSIAEAAEKLQPHADGLDEIFGTMLRSAFTDLREIDAELWASLEAVEEDKKEEEKRGHEHQWGIRVSGLAKCRVEGCDAEDYDSSWGAGLFTDWPRGHHKPYGA